MNIVKGVSLVNNFDSYNKLEVHDLSKLYFFIKPFYIETKPKFLLISERMYF